jgi:uncharacterized protein YecE (DUF72 family)
MADLRIGISGWTYAPWRGSFYPPGLPVDEELAYASRRLRSIEVNGTFYSLQRPEVFRRWYDATPPHFVFAVKAGRYITHFRRLADVAGPLANFFASGVLGLGDKLGPFLWQLPPWLPFQPERMERFLAMLPPDTGVAAQIAAGHDPWMEERAAYAIDRVRPLRHAIEVRHPSFATPAWVEMLRRHGVAAVVADTAGRWPRIEDVTADFVYLRLHGDVELYVSGYDDGALDRWASRVRAWAAGGEPEDAHRVHPDAAPPAGERDVYVYFDNDVKVRAPADAAALAERLGVGVRAPVPA